MDEAAVLALYDRQLRRDAGPDSPDARVERVGGVVRRVGARRGWTGVVWSDLDETTADAAIAEQVRYFTALDREFEWKTYAHDHPADLGDRLRAAGFRPEDEETLLVAEVAELSSSAELPDGVQVRPVTDAAGVDLMAEVHERAFGTDSAQLRQEVLAQLADRPGAVSAMVVMAGDVPVSSARMELPAGVQFAGLWGGGTVAEWRGRGLYRALVAIRAGMAAERGYRYLQVDASSQSRPILERLGFVPLSTTTPYVYLPPVGKITHTAGLSA